MNPILTKAYTAAGAVTRHRIAAHGSADGEAAQASAATDALMGVFDLDAADGARVDVHRMGLVDVEYGGVVSAGAELTADASGRAIARTALTQSAIGQAEIDGVSGDIGTVLLQLTAADAAA